MKIMKKALSTALTATLLASLLAIGTVGTVSAAASTYLGVCTPASCSQVADGASQIQVNAAAVATAANGGFITITGATFSGASGALDANSNFTYVNSTRVDIVTQGTGSLAVGDYVRVVAPAAAGTATLTVWTYSATWVASSEGTKDLTFTSAASLEVSAANSTVTASATSLKSDGSNVATVTVVVKDSASPTPNTLTSGITVNATITPIGLVENNTVAGYAQVSADGTSTYVFNVKGSGIAGGATLALSVTKGSTTTLLPSVSFTFTGAIASVIATNNVYSLVVAGGNIADIVRFTAKDAAGNLVATAASTAVSSNVAILTVVSPATGEADGALLAGKVGLDCLALGSATVTVTSGGIASNAVTVYCSDVTATVTVTFSATTIVPGGTATVTVEAKDAGGRPVADATGVSSFLVSSGVSTPITTTSNGKATATYLAPFNTGTVTALATVGGITGSGSASISAPAPLPGTGTNASALGVTTAGPFSTTTKVAALGKYQTFKISYGAGAAGSTVGILVATKNSAGVWSGFTRVTGRVADSSGTVYYYVRNSSATWISLRGDLSGSLSNAVQGRWR